MSETAQTIIVAAMVLAAVLYLALRGRKKAGCGKGCGCDAKKKSGGFSDRQIERSPDGSRP